MSRSSMTRKPGLLAVLLSLAILPWAHALPSWEKISDTPAGMPCRSVLAHPRESSKILIASEKQIFEGFPDNGWKSLGALNGAAKIRKIFMTPEIPGMIFVLTTDGLFLGPSSNGLWVKIFQGVAANQKSVLSFAVLPSDPDHWFAATESGLFESDDAGKTWYPADGFAHSARVSLVAFAQDRLFVAANERLFFSDDLTNFRTAFSLNHTDLMPEATLSDLEADSPAGEREEEDLPNGAAAYFSKLIPDPEDPHHLWLGTLRGVFESTDQGLSWKALTQSGLRSARILDLAYEPVSGQIFTATPRGIYVYAKPGQSWREIFQGLGTHQVFSIAIADAESRQLVAATAEGLVRCPIPEIVPGPAEFLMPDEARVRLFRKLILSEPTARDIHIAVVRYADLKNSKIKRWHWQSRLSALLPSFSVGSGLSRQNSIDLDRGGTSDPDTYILGPEDISKSLDMDARWDFSSLVWDTNQTSIDSRGKMMVELRQDLLSEATRVYYERRRLQMEIIFTPAAQAMDHFEKLVRLEELTALLDAMTDGYLGKRLQTLYLQASDLQQLWELPGDLRASRSNLSWPQAA